MLQVNGQVMSFISFGKYFGRVGNLMLILKESYRALSSMLAMCGTNDLFVLPLIFGASMKKE